jgi:hypothetical protein
MNSQLVAGCRCGHKASGSGRPTSLPSLPSRASHRRPMITPVKVRHLCIGFSLHIGTRHWMIGHLVRYSPFSPSITPFLAPHPRQPPSPLPLSSSLFPSPSSVPLPPSKQAQLGDLAEIVVSPFFMQDLVVGLAIVVGVGGALYNGLKPEPTVCDICAGNGGIKCFACDVSAGGALRCSFFCLRMLFFLSLCQMISIRRRPPPRRRLLFSPL